MFYKKNKTNRINLFAMLLSAMTACNSGSSDVQQAAERLVAVPKWHISEILIDDSPIYKNKKHIDHISGIRFDTYMDWVRFDKSGLFEGHFNYKPANVTEKFQWQSYPLTKVIALRDTVNKTGGWNIYPRTVEEDKFEMEVYSSAYDEGRKTKVTLRFVK